MIRFEHISAKRVSAIIIVVAFLLSITSCSQTGLKDINKKGRKIISADSPWFDSEVIDIGLGVDAERSIEDLHPKYAGSDDKYIVVFVNGYYRVDWSKVTTNSDWAIKKVVLIDRLTKQISKTIDLYSIPDIGTWPERVIYSHGQLIIKCNWWDEENDTYYDKDVYIDPDSTKVINTCQFQRDIDLKFYDSYDIGKYRIETINDQRSGFSSYILRIYSPDSDMKEVDVKLSGRDIYGIPTILALDSTTALIPVALERDYKYFKLDLDTFDIFEVNAKEYEWLDVDSIYSSLSSSDGKMYYSTEQGIFSIDINSKTIEKVFDYNWCGVNKKYLKRTEIAEYSDNSIVLCGRYNASAFGADYIKSFVIIELTKLDKNPHAGKTVIELYSPDGKTDETVSDAVIKYNDTNSKFFIELSDRFNRNNYTHSEDIDSVDDYDSAQLNTNMKLSDDLAMALMNGEGPDIIMNTISLGQLNNDNCLIDLSPYFSELSPNKYFENIINGAKSGDKLYQFPISFTIEGIQTDPENAGKSGVGFTIDEYEKFLYETLNGKDVIESGQNLYFTKIFNGMSDKFITNNVVDFSGTDFVLIADYVKDNVKENSLSWSIIANENPDSIDFTTKGNKTAYYCNCPGISGYLVKRAQIKNGTAILGIPSSDGRGPMFGTDISVAISAHTVNVEACIEFVKILLSDDIQNEFVMRDKLVLNRDAFKIGCDAAIEHFNTEEGSQNLYDYAAGTYVTSHIKFSSDDRDNLEHIILSCSKMSSSDSAIDLILIEEMPAYFLGQKDLDSVVLIMQDRAQKVLDERQ